MTDGQAVAVFVFLAPLLLAALIYWAWEKIEKIVGKRGQAHGRKGTAGNLHSRDIDLFNQGGDGVLQIPETSWLRMCPQKQRKKRARLTEEQTAQVRQMRAYGYSRSIIADQLRISVGLIRGAERKAPANVGITGKGAQA